MGLFLCLQGRRRGFAFHTVDRDDHWLECRDDLARMMVPDASIMA